MRKSTFFDDVLLNQKNGEIMQILSELCQYLEDKKPFLFNPLLMNGKTETGKSHIMAMLKKNYPNKVQCVQIGDIVYQNIPKNTKAEIQAEIKTTDNQRDKEIDPATLPKDEAKEQEYNQNNQSREQFREQGKNPLAKALTPKSGTKLLIIDDIQRMAEQNTYGQSVFQEQFSYYLDKTMQKIPVLVLRNTDSLTILPKQIESKINSGLCFNLAEPDLDIRNRFVQKIFEENDIKISKEQALFIARRSTGFRNIQTILNHVKYYVQTMQKMPAMQDIELIVAKQGQSFTLNADIILATVAGHYGFTIKDIKGKKRYPRIAEARHLSIYLCRNLLGETYVEIGRIFGGKDHSTIVHSIRKIEDLRVTNKVMNNLVTEVTIKCQNAMNTAK